MHNDLSKAETPPSFDLLTAYGYDAELEQRFRDAEDPSGGALPGRVIFQSREHYRVITGAGDRAARLAGRLRRLPECRVACSAMP